jgi:phosphatidylglycerol:prolipoprotein diacylglycerol transferase
MPIPIVPVALLSSVLATILWAPDPIAFHLGPVPVFWYGVCYAVGIATAYVVITREARRRGLVAQLVDNGIIIVAVAALIGGRLYHVIDQWQLYKDDLTRIFLPPYSGLGVYGGIVVGTLTAWYLTRRWHQSFWKWADVVAPGLFVMQAIGRWGNFFNQELYGPPTNLPWGIPIDCAHRVGDHGIAQYPCDAYPEATTAFHPLFLYESISGILGAIVLLWLARRYGPRMRVGDLFFIFLIWYAAVRLVLETFRTGNWTFFGVPTAILVSVLAIVGTLIVLAWRHRPGSTVERWGEAPEPEDGEDWLDEDEDDVEDDVDEDEVADDEAGETANGPEGAEEPDIEEEDGLDDPAGASDERPGPAA